MILNRERSRKYDSERTINYLSLANWCAISGEKAEEAYDIGVVSTQLEGRIVFDEDSVGMQLIPIVALYGGDFLCLNYLEDAENPSICIWYHEESYELEPAIELVAINFTEFLVMLQD